MPDTTNAPRIYPAYLDRAEAARYLGLARRTLDNWSHRGCGPRFYRVGKACRYRQADLDEWLEGRVVECDQHSNE